MQIQRSTHLVVTENRPHMYIFLLTKSATYQSVVVSLLLQFLPSLHVWEPVLTFTEGTLRFQTNRVLLSFPFSDRCEAERGSLTFAGPHSQEIMESTVVVSVSGSHPISLYLPTTCFQTTPPHTHTMLLVLFPSSLIKTQKQLGPSFPL